MPFSNIHNPAQNCSSRFAYIRASVCFKQKCLSDHRTASKTTPPTPPNLSDVGIRGAFSKFSEIDNPIHWVQDACRIWTWLELYPLLFRCMTEYNIMIVFEERLSESGCCYLHLFNSLHPTPHCDDSMMAFLPSKQVLPSDVGSDNLVCLKHTEPLRWCFYCSIYYCQCECVTGKHRMCSGNFPWKGKKRS